MTILALDVGSSSVRAILFDHDDDGVRIIPNASAQRHYAFDADEAGQSTIDAGDLRGLVERCIDAILQHPHAQAIEAVGMDTFVGNLIAVDGQNEALTPVITYADTRGAAQVERARQALDGALIHHETGAIIHTAYWPAKLAHFDDRHPLEPLIVGYQDFATHCYAHWFGSSPMSFSAAAWSGLLHRETLGWHAAWLAYLNTPASMLPQLTDYRAAQRGLTAAYAARWPQLAEVPFYLSVGDGAAAQVGSGAIAAHTATLTVGTTAAMRVTDTRPLPDVPDGLWSYRIDEPHHLLGGALSEGGNIFAWARETLRLDLDALQRGLSTREPGGHGLVVLPLLAGERSPGWWSAATGAIRGLRLSTTPLDICHALLEGVALRLALIAQQLDLSASTQIMASGGALSHSPAWAQIIADALGKPLHILDEPEITALGTAHMANCALRNQPLSGAAPHVAEVIQPRPEYAGRYADLSDQQRTLYRTMRGEV